MKNYGSGIDIGTTGVKVIIFDMEAPLSAVPTVVSLYRWGWVEQDGETTWQQTCEYPEAITKAGVDRLRNPALRWPFHPALYLYPGGSKPACVALRGRLPSHGPGQPVL